MSNHKHNRKVRLTAINGVVVCQNALALLKRALYQGKLVEYWRGK